MAKKGDDAWDQRPVDEATRERFKNSSQDDCNRNMTLSNSLDVTGVSQSALLCNSTPRAHKNHRDRLCYNSLDGDTMVDMPRPVFSASEVTPLLKGSRTVGARNDGSGNVGHVKEGREGHVKEGSGHEGHEEERPRVPWMELMTALLACFTPYSRGVVTGYTSPSIGRFIDSKMLTHGESAFFGGLVNFGGILSCLVVSFALDFLGRRGTLMAAAVPQFIGWICICFAHEHVALIVGRVLNGFGSAVVFSAFNIYIAETAHRSRRGALCTLCEMFISFGTTSAFLIGQFVTNQTLAGIGAGLSLMMFVAMIPLRESPRWLIQKGRLGEGIATLLWLRGGTERRVQEEFNDISDKLQECGNYPRSIWTGGGWREIKSLRKPLFICLVMMLLQGFGGTVALVAFMQTIFERAHFAHPGAATVGVGVLRMIATGLAGFLVDRVGRKKLLICGGLIQVFSLCALSSSFYLQNAISLLPVHHNATLLGSSSSSDSVPLLMSTLSPHASMEAQLLTFVSVGSIATFLFAYSLGWGTVPSVVISEIFPQRQRAVAGSIISLAGLTTGTLCAFSFKPLCHVFGVGGAFCFYAVTCLAGVVFVSLALPETKNRTLEELAEAMTSRHEDTLTSEDVSGRAVMTGNVTCVGGGALVGGVAYQVSDINASNSSGEGSFFDIERRPLLK